MSIRYLEKELKNTKECVDAINEYYKKSDWKRITKYSLKFKEYQKENKKDIRVFFDGEEYFSIVSEQEKVNLLCSNIDLRELKDLIKKVQKESNKFYTHDYGEIYLNPYEKSLHIVCGDGGYAYSDKSGKDVMKMFMEGNDEILDVDETCFTDLVEELKNCDYLDEYFPEAYDVTKFKFNEKTEFNGDYFLIGQMNDISFFYEEMEVAEKELVTDEQKIINLKISLDDAISFENFELCAKIRDEIIELEKKIKT